jgi:hypothetical protein
MASWGRKVDVELTGLGSIESNTSIIIGTESAFTEEVDVGNLIVIGEGDAFVVTSVDDDDTLSVDPKSSVDLIDDPMFLSETPKYLTTDQAINEAMFVTIADAQDANNRVDGIKTPGWTLYKEYTTESGDVRRVVETLVAMKQTSIL